MVETRVKMSAPHASDTKIFARNSGEREEASLAHRLPRLHIRHVRKILFISSSTRNGIEINLRHPGDLPFGASSRMEAVKFNNVEIPHLFRGGFFYGLFMDFVY